MQHTGDEGDDVANGSSLIWLIEAFGRVIDQWQLQRHTHTITCCCPLHELLDDVLDSGVTITQMLYNARSL
jgi:hypothetical protein